MILLTLFAALFISTATASAGNVKESSRYKVGSNAAHYECLQNTGSDAYVSRRTEDPMDLERRAAFLDTLLCRPQSLNGPSVEVTPASNDISMTLSPVEPQPATYHSKQPFNPRTEMPKMWNVYELPKCISRIVVFGVLPDFERLLEHFKRYGVIDRAWFVDESMHKRQHFAFIEFSEAQAAAAAAVADAEKLDIRIGVDFAETRYARRTYSLCLTFGGTLPNTVCLDFLNETFGRTVKFLVRKDPQSGAKVYITFTTAKAADAAQDYFERMGKCMVTR